MRCSISWNLRSRIPASFRFLYMNPGAQTYGTCMRSRYWSCRVPRQQEKRRCRERAGYTVWETGEGCKEGFARRGCAHRQLLYDARSDALFSPGFVVDTFNSNAINVRVVNIGLHNDGTPKRKKKKRDSRKKREEIFAPVAESKSNALKRCTSRDICLP